MVCGSVESFESHYADSFDVEFALWVGINDELDLVANHELFAQFLDGRGATYHQTLFEADGHFQDGHSARFVRLIVPEVLGAASSFFGS